MLYMVVWLVDTLVGWLIDMLVAWQLIVFIIPEWSSIETANVKSAF